MEPSTPYSSYNQYNQYPGQGRRRLYMLAAAVGGTILLIILLIMFLSRGSYGTLVVTAPKETKNNTQVSVDITGDHIDTQTISLKPGASQELKIKTGTVRVDGKAGDIRAVDVVVINKGKQSKITTPSGEERGVKQLGADAEYCPALSGDNLYSFSCGEGREGGIVYHKPLPFGMSDNRYLYNGQVFTDAQAYKNGIIAYERISDDSEKLIYVNLADQSKQILPLNAEVDKAYGRDFPTLVVSGQPGDSRFALMFMQENVIFVFKDSTDTNPVKITPSKDSRMDSSGRQTSGSFSTDRFIQYAGKGELHNENEGTEDDSTKEDTTNDLATNLVEYDTAGKAVRTTPLPETETITSMSKLTGDFYVGQGEADFTFYHYDSTAREMKAVYDIDDVASWTVWQNKAYVQAGNILYEFAPGKNGQFGLHSLFSSSKYRVSAVYNSPKGILFTAFAGTETTSPLNIYQLLDTPAPDEEEVEATNPAAIQRIEPAFTGFDQFLDLGMPSEELDYLKFGFNKFIATLPRQVNQVGVTGIEYGDSASGGSVQTATFTANVDGANYQAAISYQIYNFLQLTISDTGNKQVFDSGRITSID